MSADDGFLYAVNPDGTLKWKFNTGVPFQSNANGPAVSAAGTIYFGTLSGTASAASKGFLFAINPDGTQKWVISSTGTGQYSAGFTAPAIAQDGTIYTAAALDGYLVALNPSGSSKFQLPLAGLGSLSSPALGPDGTIYVPTFFGVTDSRLVAVTPAGVVKWTVSLQNRGPNLSYGQNSSATVDPVSGIVYTASDDFLFAFNPDGTSRWVFDLAGSVGASPSVTQYPVAIAPDGSLRVSDQSHLYSVSPIGTLNWSAAGVFFPGVLTVDAAGNVFAYNGNSNTLTMYNAAGATKWSFPETTIGGATIRSDGLVITGNLAGQLVALANTAPQNLSLTTPISAPATYQQLPITALVINGIGSPVANVAVNFSVIGGSGTLTPATAVSNGAGQATVMFTGLTSGLQTIQASTGTLVATLNIVTTLKNLAPTSWPGYQHDVEHTGRGSGTAPANNPGAVWIAQLGGGIRSEASVAVDSTVYVSADDGFLYAVNPDGTLKWKFNTGVPFQSNTNGPAVSASGTIYFGTLSGTPTSASKGFLFAINPDGTQKWVVSSTGMGQFSGGFTAPVIAQDGTIYTAANLDGYLVALNPDGSSKFQLPIAGLSSFSSPTLGPDGTIYIPTFFSITDSRLVAVTPAGVVKWTVSLQNRGPNLSYGQNSSATVDPTSGIIYTASDDYLFAFNPDGTSRWVFDLSGSVGASPSVTQYPVVIAPDGSLRVSDQSHLYSVSPAGTLNWSAAGVFSPGVLTVDAVGNVFAYNGTSNTLTMYDTAGLAKWSFPETTIGGATIRSDGLVITGNFAGQLIALTNTAPQNLSLTTPVSAPATYQQIPVTALVTSAIGSPVANVAVNFSVIGGSGTLTPATALSNGSGQATVVFTGLTSGLQTIQASTGTLVATLNIVTTLKNLASTSWPGYQHDVGHTGRGVGTGPTNAPGTVWTAQLGGGIRSQASIAVDSTVYVSADDGFLYAVNPGGSLKWKFSTGVPFQSNANGPAVSAAGTIYFGTLSGTPTSASKGFLFAINPDGTQKWVVSSTGTGQFSGGFTAPTIAQDGTIYTAANLDGYLVALNPDGSSKFQLPVAGLSSFSSPVLGPDGTIYIPTFFSITDSRLVAVTPAGTVKWTVNLQNRGPASSGQNSSATVDPVTGIIYTASDDFLFAFNPDGTSRWVFDLSGSVGASPSVTQYPVVIAPDGSLRVSDQSHLYSVSPNGTLNWSAAGVFSPGVLTTDAAGNVFAYNGTANTLTMYDATGFPKWSLPETVIGGATIRSDGLIITGNFSGQLAAIQGFMTSSPDQLVNLKSGVPNISIATVSTASPSVSLALASATASGLILVSSIYDITPSTPFSPSAVLTFNFNSAVIPDTTTLAIYRFDGVSWSSAGVTSQFIVVGPTSYVTGQLAHSSYYALFRRDIVPPLTTLSIDGQPLPATNAVIVSTDSIGFSAADVGVGVAQTFYSIDGSAAQVFSSTFSLSAGNHALAYHSVDFAGNVETSHLVNFTVLLYDVTPPTVTLSIVDQSTITTSSPAIVAAYNDIGRGVDASSVRLALDSVDVTSQAVITASSATYTPPLSQGSHNVAVSLADLAGNHAATSARFFVDSIPPVTTLLLDGLATATTNLIMISTDSLGFAATDSGTGVAQTLYALDGGADAGYFSTFSLATGTHTLVYHSVDRAGNAEAAKMIALAVQLYDVIPPTLSLLPLNGSTVTTTTPLISAAYFDAGRGVDVSSVRLSFDGVDVTTRSIATVSSTAFTPALPLTQGAHSFAVRVADLAGNAAASTSAFLVDSIPPTTTLIVDGLAMSSTNLVLVSTDSLGLVAADAGTGVFQALYALDGGSETIYTSTFSLVSGTHSLAFHSRDNAGNLENVKIVSLTVQLFDIIPPIVTMVPPSGSTVTTATPSIVATFSDVGRGVDVSSVRIFLDGVNVTTQSSVTVSSAVFVPSSALTQSTHTSVIQVSDLAGNRSGSTSNFLVDSIPPVTTLMVDGLATSATNLVLVSTDVLSFAAADGGSGVAQTLYAVDGSSEVVFMSIFSLAVGTHTLAFHSRDNAGNLEILRIDFVSVHSTTTATSTPPSVSLTFPSPAALGVEQTLGGVVNVRGSVSDPNLLSWTLSVAPGVSVSTGFTTIASGAANVSGQFAAWNTASITGYFTLKLLARNAAGGTAVATATAFVGRPFIDFSIGKRDSSAVISSLKNPQGIVVRPDGLIWIAVDDDSRLLLVTSSGALVAAVGGGRGNESGDDRDDRQGRTTRTVVFKHPRGLSLDAANNLYVADRDDDRVVKLSSDGSQVLLEFANGLKHPNDAVVDADGSVFVADTEHGRVRVFDTGGAVLRDIPTGGGGRPWGVALSSQGLWVSDQSRQTISLFTRGGALLKTMAGGGRVRGASVDHIEALYVVDRSNDRLNKYDPLGSPLWSIGARRDEDDGPRRRVAYLSDPSDAAIGPDGALWVADSGHDRIVRYELPTGLTRNAYYAATVTDTPLVAPVSLTAPAARNVDPVEGGKVERDDGTGVRVPSNALASTLQLTVQSADATQDADAKQKRRLANKIQPASEEVQYGPEGTAFAVPVTVTISYDPVQIAMQGLSEDQLKIHYWNPTLDDWQALDSTVDRGAKTVSALTTHFSVYQVMGAGGSGIGVAAANAAFGLQAAYAFPNPVRGANAVTIRVQPGLADSVEVRIYDLAGRKVHSSSAFTITQLDDGNGLGVQYTYDNVWDISGMGSGVYQYVLTAKKSGQSDIHKAGRVAIVK